tara:strand:- start:140 stop:313 length:174 start_codon:yes stop_codon:yes gene_type:complete
MAKPNYAFAKRQRDLAKQKKKEEKRQKKAAAANDAPDTATDTDTTDSPPASNFSGQA